MLIIPDFKMKIGCLKILKIGFVCIYLKLNGHLIGWYLKIGWEGMAEPEK